jgi:bacterioferritin-associated ferredoxin
MIVCICNAYRSAEIEAKARETGIADAYALYQAMGAAPRCGCCLETAQELVDDVHGVPHCGLKKAAE